MANINKNEYHGIPVLFPLLDTQWKTNPNHTAIDALESGKIIFFPQLQFELINSEKTLLSSDYSNRKSKNISYNSLSNEIKGLNSSHNNISIENTFKTFLKRYAQYAYQLMISLNPAYKKHLQIGRTSFRPIEIQGRKAPSYRKDDTRLHVDAFPANPNQGKRILRVFSNIHPKGKPRCWRVGESFEEVAKKFLPKIPRQIILSKQLLKLFQITKSERTEYDHIMLHIHNKMKKDMHYQSTAPYTEINFPSFSTWIVFTDSVSHSALAGQHLLEQTFYLPVNAMLNPNYSPLKILQKLTAIELV